MAVADIFIRIVTKGAELADKQMKGLGGTTSKLSGIVKGAGLAFATALAVGIGKATKQFVEFEDALNQSLAIMDTTIAEQEKMAQAARDVATSTRISATESAESFFFLASAGLDAEQSIAALPQVAKFAQAGMFDMSTATDLATDAQSALGLTVKDAQQNLENLTRVTDVLVKANTLANASVQQFSEALTTKAGAALKVVNKDIEEGVAVLAAFADRGVKGAEAGDKLNQILRDIPRATAKNSEAFQALGLNMFDTEGNMKNVADIIEELDAVLGPMSDEMKAATLDQLGLNRGVADAVKILSGAGDQIREYEQALRDSGGTTEQVADVQIQSLAAQAEIMKNKFNELGLLIVNQLSPALEGAIGLVDRFLDIVIDGVGGLDEYVNANEEFVKITGISEGQIHSTNSALNDQLISQQKSRNQIMSTTRAHKEYQEGMQRVEQEQHFFNLTQEDAIKNAHRYEIEQMNLADTIDNTTEQIEDQTNASADLSKEMVDNQFNAIMAMIDAEEAYNSILEEQEELLQRQQDRKKDKVSAEQALTKATEKVKKLEEELIVAREESKKITDEEKLAILRQEAAVQRLTDVENASELQKQELIVAQNRLNEIREKAIGDDQNVIKIIRELESARSEEQRAVDNLADAQNRLNEATEDYNDATAKTPANLLRIAEAKRQLDDAIANVEAFDTIRGAIDSIAEHTGEKFGAIYQDIMKVINLRPPTETVSTPPPTLPFQNQNATQELVTDTNILGGRRPTTLLTIQNQFNITGELNSDEVAIKTIEAQKRGLNVVL